jgi:Cysteine rich repeat
MRYLLPVIAMLFVTAVAAAPTESTEGPQRGTCREEINKVCADTKPGDGRIKQCVEANRDKLSPGCQQRMSHAHDKAAAHKACQNDAQKLCPGVEPGGGKLHQCLRKNEAALTEDCRASLKHKPRPAKDPA